MINLLFVLLAYLFMEFVAWSNHKYVMHGFLWTWHADHHRKDHQKGLPLQTEKKRFEKNDYFFLVYALPAIVLMITGFLTGYWPAVFIAAGITLYGLTYFVIHDIIIHKRLNVPFLHGTLNRYTRAIVRAHTAHHHPKSKQDFQNYGLLIFPHRYFKENH
jgi:beta-carotene 3-hydroxylase